MRKQIGPLTISGVAWFKVKIDPDVHVWIKHHFFPFTCNWGYCYKPATRWIKSKNSYYIGGKYCQYHAMWQCKNLHGFSGSPPAGSYPPGDPRWFDSGKNFKHWVKRHKTHSRCIPTTEEKIQITADRKASITEYLGR
jgi:hypothetical protein